MNRWSTDIEAAVEDYLAVAALSHGPISRTEIENKFPNAPHAPSSRISTGMMAIYGFWHDGVWLKIGKVGPNSHARFVSQHFNAKSSRSNLAASLTMDVQMAAVVGTDPLSVNHWIRTSTNRVNIFLPATRQLLLLTLLKAFLHVRLQPRFEG